jgi:hypothetical protein
LLGFAGYTGGNEGAAGACQVLINKETSLTMGAFVFGAAVIALGDIETAELAFA